jgi:hypothetical protein
MLMEINYIAVEHLYTNNKKSVHLFIDRRQKLYLFFNIIKQV